MTLEIGHRTLDIGHWTLDTFLDKNSRFPYIRRRRDLGSLGHILNEHLGSEIYIFEAHVKIIEKEAHDDFVLNIRLDCIENCLLNIIINNIQ